MAIWKIPVAWEMYGLVEIEAETAKEALRIFSKTEDEIPLPEGEYVDGSFRMTQQSNMTPAEYVEYATENYIK